MVRSLLHVLAENALLDVQTNQMTIVSMIEEFQVPSFPLVIPRMVFVSLLERDPEDPVDIQCRIEAQLDGEKLFEGDLPVKFQDKLRVRSVSNFRNAVIPREGEFVISFRNAEGDKSEICRWSAFVRSPPETGETKAEAAGQN